MNFKKFNSRIVGITKVGIPSGHYYNIVHIKYIDRVSIINIK